MLNSAIRFLQYFKNDFRINESNAKDNKLYFSNCFQAFDIFFISRWN